MWSKASPVSNRSLEEESDVLAFDGRSKLLVHRTTAHG
jgi:hypothetical protein